MFRGPIRVFPLLALLLAAAPAAMGHFVFVVPNATADSATVILSEDLTPDTEVKPEPLAKTQLFARRGSAGNFDLKLTAVEAANRVDLSAFKDTSLLYGDLTFGVQQRGQGKPFLLAYHPKTLLSYPLNTDLNTIGKSAPAEIVPVGTPGDLRLKVLVAGKPTADLEVNVLLPDGTQQKARTDAQGLTASFSQQGRFGAWVRCVVLSAGEFEGKKYEEIRHYPTLVADIGTAKPVEKSGQPAAASAKLPSAPTSAALLPATLPASAAGLKLPEATSSFGAAVSDGWLYVYGGHIAKTHSYSTAAVSGQFNRINLAQPERWESLPSGPGLQGMNLAAHGGKIYRVGGMEPRNKPGEKADNFSVATVARFDPSLGKWENLPPLPEPRSSHDVAVVGDKLVVVGGWNMQGREGDDEFHSTAAILDLSAKSLAWKTVKQPFERRALIAAVRDGKVYVIGGFGDESKPSLQVDVYDVAAERWTKGPELPGPPLNGFAPAACVVEKRIYASVGDGSLYRLDDAAGKWEKVAATTPRIVHRLAVMGTKIYIAGGANKGQNFDLVEVVDVGAATKR